MNTLRGPDSINMKTTRLSEVNNKYLNERGVAPTRIQQNISREALGQVTHRKDTAPNEIINDRLDPSLLDAYRRNPYTKPLPSYYA